MHLAHEQAGKALAALLTHISNSHTALAKQLAEQGSNNAVASKAKSPVTARPLTPSNSSHAQASIADGNSSIPDPMIDQQHADSQKQDPSDADTTADSATPVKLCAFQQELVQRFMQANNSVMFLPSGTLTEPDHSLLLAHHSQATHLFTQLILQALLHELQMSF